MPTSTNFDEIRRWHGHYGSTGALYSTWSLGQSELRYMAEKPSGAVSLNDFSGKIGYLAKDPSHFGTSDDFRYPGRTIIDLMENPNSPTYGSTPDNQSIVFGDPMGDVFFTRLQGGKSTASAIFSSVLFYFDKSTPLSISFDYVHEGTIPNKQFNVVIVEYRDEWQGSDGKILISKNIGGLSGLKTYTTSGAMDPAYPYKEISLQNNTGSGNSSSSAYNQIRVGNMRITG